MTCAHVVNAALGRDARCAERPDAVLRLDLPLAGVAGAEAELVEWHPPVAPDQRDAGRPSDIAVLRLKTATTAPAARLAQDRAAWGREFRTFGFPVKDGQPADAETMEADAGGWVHFRPTRDYGHLIKPGFSGAPAIAADDNTVLGMIVAVQRGDDSRVAYGEPIRRLQMAWPLLARPYKGLARFDPGDADFFFGREVLIEDLLGRIARDPVTLIVGASGGGKSSLVYGGVLPKLDSAAWNVASFRPGREPLDNLAWALAELLEWPSDAGKLKDRARQLRQELGQAPSELFATARALRRTSGARLLLVADQFEELFTLCRDEDERNAFIELVARVAGQPAPAPVVLVATLRADFMGEVLGVSALGEALDGRYLMLRAMNGDELGRAIREPARKLGVAFESGVDDLILAAVAKDAAALPLMEFALERLWGEQENRRLTRAAYDCMGGLEGALARHADDIVDCMSEPEQDAVRRLLCRLVNVVRPGEGEDTKRPQSRQELGEPLWSMAQRLSGQADGESTQALARIVVLYRDEQQREVADIIHEALIRQWPRLQDWLNDERDYLLLVDELQGMRRRWEDGQLTDRLLRGRDLAQAAENRERLLADHPELGVFIEASDENTQQERARQQADAIWEPLGFQPGEILPRELEALLELASANDRVRRAFLQRLYEFPERAKRFCRLPAPVVRAALGLRGDRAELIQNSVPLGVDGPPEIIAAALLLRAGSGVCGIDAGEMLNAIRTPQSLSHDLVGAVGAWARVAAEHLDTARSNDLLRVVLSVIGQTTDRNQLEVLGQAAETLAARLDADHASRALDFALDAINRPQHDSQRPAFRQAAQALAVRMNADCATRALNRILDAIGRTGSSSELLALGQVAKVLAGAMDAKHLDRALERVLNSLGQASHFDQVWALEKAAEALAAAGAQADAALSSHVLDHVLEALGSTTDPVQLQALGQAAQVLLTVGARLDALHAGAALEGLLYQVIRTAPTSRKFGPLVLGCFVGSPRAWRGEWMAITQAVRSSACSGLSTSPWSAIRLMHLDGLRRPWRGRWLATVPARRSTMCWTPSSKPRTSIRPRHLGGLRRHWRGGWLATALARRSTARWTLSARPRTRIASRCSGRPPCRWRCAWSGIAPIARSTACWTPSSRLRTPIRRRRLL